MSAEGIIGFHFFENERGQTVTINSDRYTDMLRNFFFPQLNSFEAYNSRAWFQLDGATSNESLAVVNEMFTGKLISRQGDSGRGLLGAQISRHWIFFSGSTSRAAFMPINRRQLPSSRTCFEEIFAIPRAMCQRVFTNLGLRFEVYVWMVHLSVVI